MSVDWKYDEKLEEKISLLGVEVIECSKLKETHEMNELKLEMSLGISISGPSDEKGTRNNGERTLEENNDMDKVEKSLTASSNGERDLGPKEGEIITPRTKQQEAEMGWGGENPITRRANQLVENYSSPLLLKYNSPITEGTLVISLLGRPDIKPLSHSDGGD